MESVNRLIREDSPYYIAAGFIKLFPEGKGDYWAWLHVRQQQNLPVSLWEWIKHMLLIADGRFQAHPRFYFFALNTALRNKALRSRSYFVKQQYGASANTAYTSEQLFKMGKQEFVKIVSAFEHSIAGSVQEKMQQRSDLEAFCEQIEQDTHMQHVESAQRAVLQAQELTQRAFCKDSQRLRTLQEQSRIMSERLQEYQLGITAGSGSASDLTAPASQEAASTGEFGITAGSGSASALTAPASQEAASTGNTDPDTKIDELLDMLYALGQRLNVGGEIPCHFTTLTTAIYQWQDLAELLETYERETTARRGGRRDPLEPSELRLTPHKRRVLRYPGVVAWFCSYKLELFFMHVM